MFVERCYLLTEMKEAQMSARLNYISTLPDNTACGKIVATVQVTTVSIKWNKIQQSSTDAEQIYQRNALDMFKPMT